MQSQLWKSNQTIWEDVRQKVKHAVVYIDNKMAELLHWSGGLDVLLSAGAVDVRDFSSFESGDENQVKAVFLVSSALEEVTEEVIRDIVTQSQFQYVVVMTTVSPLLHSGKMISDDGDRDFGEFEDQVLEWMGNMNYTVEVVHIPLFSALICPDLFLAPAFSQLYPLMASDVKQISYQYSTLHPTRDSRPLESLADIECHHLPDPLQNQIKSLASGLHALLQILDVREDVYSIGHTSRILATELESYPPARSRRKACQNRASLIILDRTLDVTAAVTHQVDTLFDRLTNTLTLLPGHCSDRKVDMRPICNVVQNERSDVTVIAGSLASTTSSHPASHLAPLVFKKQKEALMDVNRRLVETAAAEKLPLDLSSRPGRVTADQLDSTVALFKGNYPMIAKHLDLLQVAMATSQTLKHPRSSLLDMLTAKEKSLVLAVAEEGDIAPSGLAVMSKVIAEERAKVKGERTLGIDEILSLLCFMFSVSDGDCGDETEASRVRDQLVDWILQDKDDLPPLTKQIVGETVTESILGDQVESLWDKLRAIGDVRRGMQQFRSVLDPGDAMTPAHVKPLLRQLMEKIVHPGKADLPDVECKTGGLKDLLKSGFGFFKGSGKPRPGDAPLLILFIIGGISANEVKQIKEVVDKAKPGFEVLVGSSHLPSAVDTVQSLLVKDNINLEVL